MRRTRWNKTGTVSSACDPKNATGNGCLFYKTFAIQVKFITNKLPTHKMYLTGRYKKGIPTKQNLRTLV